MKAMAVMIPGRVAGKDGGTWPAAINVVRALVELGKLDERRYRPHVTCALGAMVEASRALKMSGATSMDAPALLALREIVMAYDDAIWRFAVQIISVASARVVLTIANAQAHEACGAVVINSTGTHDAIVRRALEANSPITNRCPTAFDKKILRSRH
jgi:hypothetical protein